MTKRLLHVHIHIQKVLYTIDHVYTDSVRSHQWVPLLTANKIKNVRQMIWDKTDSVDVVHATQTVIIKPFLTSTLLEKQAPCSEARGVWFLSHRQHWQ